MTSLLLSGAVNAVIFMKKLLKKKVHYLFGKKMFYVCFIILMVLIHIFYCMKEQNDWYIPDQFKDYKQQQQQQMSIF